MGGGGRSPCCDKSKVKKGAWSPAEDVRLVSFIHKHGHPNWRSLPKQAGLLRCGKSCRLRWINYLRPDVKRGNFTPQEEHSIIRLHAVFGNKWSKIASQLPGRTDNEIKNVWNTHLKKRSSSSPANYSCISSNAITIDIDQQQNQEISSSFVHQQAQNGNKDYIDHHHPSSSSPTISTTYDDSGYEDKKKKNVVVGLESEVEFWNMLDDIQLIHHHSQPIMIADHENGSQMEVDKWLRLLEEELGLVAPTSTR